jgi:P4 family phage/plasmid primase-like protien
MLDPATHNKTGDSHSANGTAVNGKAGEPHRKRGEWREATPLNPCPICKNSKWCSFSTDGVFVSCRRERGINGQEKQDKSGMTYYLHRLIPQLEKRRDAPKFTMADGDGKLAPPDVLHKVYLTFLKAMLLSQQHQNALTARGLKGNLLDAGYRTLGKNRLQAVRKVIAAGFENHLPSVPGFFIKPGDKGKSSYWTFSGLGGILIPVRDDESRIVALKLRLDSPKNPKDKYAYCSSKGERKGGVGPGSPVHLPLFAGDKTTARITEGELKADVATAISGILTIGLPSVSAWRRAASILRQIGAKTVRVAYDADARTNRNVAESLRNLVHDLRKEEEFAVELETWRIEDGKGIDDLLAAGKTPTIHTRDAIDAELASMAESANHADSVSKTPVDEDEVEEAIDDPHRLGRYYLTGNARFRDIGDRLRFYREQAWEWDGTRYVAVPDAEFEARLTHFVKQRLDKDYPEWAALRWNGEGPPPTVPKVTPHLVKSVCGALKGDTTVSANTPQPSWLSNPPERRNYIALRNGLLDVEAVLLLSANPLLPHNPLWFSPSCLPYDFDPEADCPKWKAFLVRNLNGDEGKARLLQQWAGYQLLHDTSLQRFLMMIGDGANGKSVVCAVLTALLGEDNVSTVPLEFFGEKFRLNGTLGKLANIVPEVGELDKMAEGQIKAFVVGDMMEFEQKYKQPFTARPTARLTLAANTAPHFSDKTDGIWRRAILLPFDVQIPVAEQTPGMDKPEWWKDAGEMPGVFRWALAGLFDLRREKTFVVPPSCRRAAENLRTESNPARRYLVDH